MIVATNSGKRLKNRVIRTKYNNAFDVLSAHSSVVCEILSIKVCCPLGRSVCLAAFNAFWSVAQTVDR